MKTPVPLRVHIPNILFVLGVVFAHGKAWTEDSSFDLWAAYTQPAHVGRVVLRNRGNDTLSLEKVWLTRTDGHVLSPFWMTVEPRRVPPGAATLISWFMAVAPGDALNPEIPTPFSDQVLHINRQEFRLRDAVSSITADYAVRDDDGSVYLYLKSSHDALPVIVGCDLGDTALERLKCVEVPQARTVLVIGQTDNFRNTKEEVPLIPVRLVSEAGAETRLFARLFHRRHTAIHAGVSLLGTHRMVGTCLTHCEDAWGQAVEKTIINATDHWGELRTIKFCNLDLAVGGPFFFAPLAEQNHIEPQLTFSDACRDGDYIGTLLNSAAHTKEWSAPGIFFSWIFPEDIHYPHRPAYSFPKLRAMIYSLLAGGSRGLEFQRLYHDDPDGDVGRNYIRLQEEIAPLEPLLAISEPVDLTAAAPSRVHVRTLLCGDRGILVFLLSRNSQPSLEAKEETVTLYAPFGIEVSAQAIEIGGALSRQKVRRDNNLLSYTCITDLATVHFIPASSKGRHDIR
ncbi:MAG: hypothetical protein ACOYI9_09975 [Candidatus Hydrogenedentales bacterium]|jgi:hypothetical protein